MPFLSSAVKGFSSDAIEQIRAALHPRLTETIVKVVGASTSTTQGELGAYREIDSALATDVVGVSVVRYDTEQKLCRVSIAKGAAGFEEEVASFYDDFDYGFDDSSSGNLEMWGFSTEVIPCRVKAGERISMAVAKPDEAGLTLFAHRATLFSLET